MGSFIEKVKKQAEKSLKRIAFDEGHDERILKAAEKIKADFAIPVLVGSKEQIEERASEAGVSLEGIEIIDSASYEKTSEIVNKFFESRKDKGVDLEKAKELMKINTYFATMLLEEGIVDCLVSGASHSTAETLRPALQIIKEYTCGGVASSYFLMIKGEEVLFFSDCAMNVDPTSEQMATIAACTAKSVCTFGIEPRVALLSYSTKGSGKGNSVDKVREAAKIANEKYPSFKIEGELQFDTAYVESVAKKKCPICKIAGTANVFIFPNLDTGNIGYKMVERLGGYKAIGPVLQGLGKPVADLSRGCSVEDIIDTAAVVALNACKVCLIN